VIWRRSRGEARHKARGEMSSARCKVRCCEILQLDTTRCSEIRRDQRRDQSNMIRAQGERPRSRGEQGLARTVLGEHIGQDIMRRNEYCEIRFT
jgi:hypothetical protein